MTMAAPVATDPDTPASHVTIPDPSKHRDDATYKPLHALMQMFAALLAEHGASVTDRQVKLRLPVTGSEIFNASYVTGSVMSIEILSRGTPTPNIERYVGFDDAGKAWFMDANGNQTRASSWPEAIATIFGDISGILEENARWSTRAARDIRSRLPTS